MNINNTTEHLLSKPYKIEKEFADNTGRDIIYIECPQYEGSKLVHLYVLYYFVDCNRAWFFDKLINESNSIRMSCYSLDQFNVLRKMLTKGSDINFSTDLDEVEYVN